MQEPKKICPSCGMPLAQDDTFCTICGTKTIDAAPAPAASPVYTAPIAPPASSSPVAPAGAVPAAPPVYTAPIAPPASSSPVAPAGHMPPRTAAAPTTQPGGWGAPPSAPATPAQPYQPTAQPNMPPQQANFAQPAYTSPSAAAYPTAVKTKKSIAPLIITLVVVLLLAGGFCVWFFLLKDGTGTPVQTGPHMIYADWPSNIRAPLDITEGYVKETGDIDIYGYTVGNSGKKTVVEYDVLIFCYDKNGRPIFDEYGENFEIDYSDAVIPADGTRSQEFQFYYSSKPEICIPFISYVLFEDGTEWGIYWDFDDPEYIALIERANEIADNYAKKSVP